MTRSAFTLLLATTFFAVLGSLTPEAHAAQPARVNAILILGSNSGTGVDPQLQRYERHLKRVAPFDSFQHRGQGERAVTVPGSGEIVIDRHHLVSFDVAPAEDGKLRIAAKWSNAGKTLIQTTVVTPRNQPTVLGGPSSNGGKLILMLVAR